MPLRVLLVRPPGRYVSLSFPDGPMVAPPRALLHLAAAVKGDPEVVIKVVDALAEPDLERVHREPPPFLFGLAPDDVADRARDFAPDLIGVTNMATYFYRETQELIAAVRAACPRALIVAGGPDPTCEYERYLYEGPGIDAIALGEGEATFAELVARLKSAPGDRSAWRDVAGLAYRDPNDRKRIVTTTPRAMAGDVEALVPDYDHVDMERYFALADSGFRSRITLRYPGVERTADVVTSRGCPYKCTFCSIHIHMGRRFRAMSPEAVLAHLEELVTRRGVRHVHFEDDIINFDRARFKAIMRGLEARRWPLTWDTPNGLRADLLDRETIELARRTGCVYFVFGVESGSARVLDDIVKKQLDLTKIEEAARICHEVGLDTLAFYIVGFPGESEAEAEATYRFAFDLYAKYGTTPILQVWRPYVGTDLHDMAIAGEGIVPIDPLALHKQHAIPYTLFRTTFGVNKSLPLGHVAGVFKRYQTEGQRLALRRWARLLMREPGLWQTTARALARAGRRIAVKPQAWQAAGQAFFFETGLYPHAIRRGIGQRSSDAAAATAS